jgi:hypothetical protein
LNFFVIQNVKLIFTVLKLQGGEKMDDIAIVCKINWLYAVVLTYDLKYYKILKRPNMRINDKVPFTKKDVVKFHSVMALQGTIAFILIMVILFSAFKHWNLGFGNNLELINTGSLNKGQSIGFGDPNLNNTDSSGNTATDNNGTVSDNGLPAASASPTVTQANNTASSTVSPKTTPTNTKSTTSTISVSSLPISTTQAKTTPVNTKQSTSSPTGQIVDFAQNKSASSSAFYSGHNPVYAVDGDLSTFCAILDKESNWFTVDLGEEKSISSVKILWSTLNYPKQFNIVVKNNEGQISVNNISCSGGSQTVSLVNVKARYITLNMYQTSNLTYSIYDLKAFGQK